LWLRRWRCLRRRCATRKGTGRRITCGCGSLRIPRSCMHSSLPSNRRRSMTMVESVTISDRAYRDLRRMILVGELPPGSRLVFNTNQIIDCDAQMNALAHGPDMERRYEQSATTQIRREPRVEIVLAFQSDCHGHGKAGFRSTISRRRHARYLDRKFRPKELHLLP